jgi:adenosylmethionine---8-amino-7-oxononanoate aminotransferase
MNNLNHLDKKNIWHPFTPLVSEFDPIVITSAQGVYLHTNDNRKIIDAISSWWVNLHGHSHPYIAKAIYQQAKNLEHVIFAGFTHEPAIKLSENLLSILPENFSKIFFSDNGSTAVEVALKMAMQYWYNQNISKNKIIALEGAYHGDTFGSMSVGSRSIFSKPFSPYLFEVDFVEFPTKITEDETLNNFKLKIQQGNVGIFIYEPLIQGAAGMRIYSPAWLDEAIKFAQQHNVICIADEVFTGFGRTGKLLATDYLSTKPDIITLSKGITGGALPLGVTGVSEKICSMFYSDDFSKTFFHGHSYTANPIACAAANASFELLTNHNCLKAINRISKQHENFTRELNSHKNISTINNLGTILSIELKTSDKSNYTNMMRKTIYAYFLSKNILMRPLGNSFYVVPPYCITEDELNIIYKAIKDFLLTIE